MKIVRIAGAYHAARIVPKPMNDKTATEYVFSIPYRRVRQDSLGQYILVKGKCIPVTLCNVQE